MHEEKIEKNRFFRSFHFFLVSGETIVPKNVKGDLIKAELTSLSSASTSSVADSASELIRLIKSVT